MQYVLMGLRNYLDEISREDFELIKLARSNLLEVLSIEEKLNFVLENYAELEQELFSISINNMLFYAEDWSSSINEIQTVNRRIINFLTTGRLYIDQMFHNIHSIYGTDSEQEKAIKQKTSTEYDSDELGYRAMEAMRNYVQHRQLPISNLTKNWRRVENNSGVFKKHTIQLGIDTKILSKDRKFKKSISDELRGWVK